MATPPTGNPVGNPTLYKPEFCQALIEHMKDGNFFDSFASYVPCSIATLYNWLRAFPEFLEAREIGNSFSLRYYENLGKDISRGRLLRLKREEPILDKDGKPTYDKNGKILMKREYEPAQGNSGAWFSLAKNIHWRHFRDKKYFEVSDPVSRDVAILTDDDMNGELEAIERKMLGAGEERAVRDITAEVIKTK